MEVKLIATTQYINREEPELYMEDDEFLSYVASQSHHREPKVISGLFEKTVDWGHESIQEFVDYTFHVKGVSRSLLAQLTWHRMANYNVMSMRKVMPEKAVIPKGIVCFEGKIHFEGGGYLKWQTDREFFVLTFFKFDKKKRILKTGDLTELPVPLEDVRFGFPIGLCTNLMMKINGRSLRNLLKLRMDHHAQWEIRELACKMYDLVENENPVLLKGLKDLREANK